MGLSGVLDRHRVVICVGCGGVGKTTTAAALAVYAAMRGKRVLCLTIDPARRLADSLGLEAMTTEEQVVPPELFTANGLVLEGELSAMMLDTKRTFDDLVRRYASSEEVAERILQNKVYGYMSGSLAGTQEYMAMEKLHALRADGAYDLIVLDTPPTSNALDFLDAPERLASLVDSPAMRWFVQAFEGAGKFSFNLVGKGAAFLLRGLSRFTGTGFLEVLAQFITDFNDLFGGFRERAAEVSSALRSEEVAFVIVTSPNPLAMEEAIFFARRLEEFEMNRDAFVINGMRALFAEPSLQEAELVALVAPHLPETMDPKRAIKRMRRAVDDARTRAIADRLQADGLRQRAGKDRLYVEVPHLEKDVHDLAALSEVAEYLSGAREVPTVDQLTVRVFLIHGMGRSPSSFAFLAHRLRRAGHRVSLFGYAVRNTSLDTIADRFAMHVAAVLEADGESSPTYAVVGHSLGNVITRMASEHLPAGFDRFAMLAPPNQPPLLARRLRDYGVFRAFTGDAGQRLADPEFFTSLPVPEVDTIILAGDAAKRITVLPFEGAPADGVVSVEETRLEPTPHRVVPAWHTFIMNHPEVFRVLSSFLEPRPE